MPSNPIMTMATMLRGTVEVLVLGVLSSILVQDWRWRGVYWYVFPLLAALLAASRLMVDPLATVALDTTLNVGFISVQLLVIALYVRLRFAAPLQAYLGLGDIFYWLAVAVFFPPILYLLYHALSLLISLVVFLCLRWLLRTPIEERLPLAGLQAACLVVLLAGSWLVPTALPRTEAWLLTYLALA